MTMRRPKTFLIITGVVGLIANALAISSYFFSQGQLPGWQPDPGLILVLAFIALAYTLVLWSAVAWRWIQRRQGRPPRPDTRPAAFLLNALVTYPLMALWTYLLLATAFQVEATTTQRWLIALAVTWALSPFIALGLIPVGEALGPLLSSGE
jgi:hypothetical protein